MRPRFTTPKYSCASGGRIPAAWSGPTVWRRSACRRSFPGPGTWPSDLHLPIPKTTMVWMIEKLTGGVPGWFVTLPLRHVLWRDQLLGLSENAQAHDLANLHDRQRAGVLNRINQEADQIQHHTRSETKLDGSFTSPLNTTLDAVAMAGADARYV